MGGTALTLVCRLTCMYMLFSPLLLVGAQQVQGSRFGVEPITYSAAVGVQYNLTVSKSTEYLLEYAKHENVSSTSPAYISVESDDAQNDHPVLIVLRQAKSVLSWQIPFTVGDSIYMSTSRILCPDENYYKYQNFSSEKLKYSVPEDNSFYVSITSGSPDIVTVRLVVRILGNFSASVNTEYQVPPPDMSFSPSQPWYYLFKWPENSTLPSRNLTGNTMNSVVVKVESDDDLCMTLSIQNLTCPVLDLETTVGYEGFRQTLDRKGGVTLTKDEYPNGFHIVFIVNGNDRKCHDKVYYTVTEEMRSKRIKFDVYETISLETFVIAVMTPIVILISIYALFLVAAIVYCCRPYNVIPPPVVNLQEENPPEPLSPPEPREGLPVAYVNDLPDIAFIADQLEAGPSGAVPSGAVPSGAGPSGDGPSGAGRQSVQYESDSDSADGQDQQPIIRVRRPLSAVVKSLADLSRIKTTKLRQRSDLYSYNLVTIATFYALPVFQLMYSNQLILQKTGNQDTCYYNFLCAYPLRITSTIVIGDFNHVFSNIGYIALGLLFIAWTLRRDAMHQFAVSRRKELDENLGIPQHYGLFYALGLALMMEGFLSGMYHICPNETNFQFDTSFMYVIAVLCMVKLYQNRHPDRNASAYTTFLILAIIIFISMVGIMENSETFFKIFSAVHVAMCLWVSVQVYRMRSVSFGDVVKGINRESCLRALRAPLRTITPNYPSRLGLIIVGNVANWVLVYLGEAYLLRRNFGSYLLNVLLTNLVLYFGFYIVMKLLWREKVKLEPLTYIVLSGILWGCSGWFFLSRVTSWASTPAGSRHSNEVCNFLHFYDNHDIWHFLSAGSMFCTFMVLLTLDDDLVETNREQIHVF